jgi:outer membrane protein assembly factor BamD (BamD/ComL family)
VPLLPAFFVLACVLISGCAVPAARTGGVLPLHDAAPAAAATAPSVKPAISPAVYPGPSNAAPPGALPYGQAGPPPAGPSPNAAAAPAGAAYGAPPAGYGQAPPAAAGPVNSGVVPIGATGVGPAGPEVVPAAAIDVPPTAPAVPGGLPPSSPDPVVAAVRPNSTKAQDDDDKGFDWEKLEPEHIWKDVKKTFGYGPDEKIAQTAFREGEALFRAKNYDEAAKKFYTASWRWPDSPLEEDAMYLMAESYFFADRYSSAHDGYANLLKKHDNTRYLDTVMNREFAIGRYWEQVDMKEPHWPVTPNLTDKTRPLFDAFGNAMAAYDMVRLHDPTGPLADAAVISIADAHFRNWHWEEAANHYDILRRDYPKSQYQKKAHILGLQSALFMYQGPLYDVKPLDNAKEIADQTLAQFRGQLGDEERKIAETRARIIELRAEREWAVAQFWEGKRAYGSARCYYKNLINKYPETLFAQHARERVQQIQGEPDNPVNHFAWLTGMFERERR